jgi:hypothetical protein
MIQPITLLGAGLALRVLYFRYKSQPKDQAKRTPKQISKTAKIIFAAALAWLTLGFTLQHMISNIDGVPAQEPSTFEKVVRFFSK